MHCEFFLNFSAFFSNSLDEAAISVEFSSYTSKVNGVIIGALSGRYRLRKISTLW